MFKRPQNILQVKNSQTLMIIRSETVIKELSKTLALVLDEMRKHVLNCLRLRMPRTRMPAAREQRLQSPLLSALHQLGEELKICPLERKNLGVSASFYKKYS